jgi:hypothetical protein
MSGAPKRSIPPRGDKEWARETQRRVEALETPITARIGPWVFSAQPGTGNLIASHVDGGSVLVAQVPSSDAAADPDVVIEPEEVVLPTRADWDLSTCSVRRTTNQSIGNAGSFTTVNFPTADWDLRQDGSSAQADGAGITIRDPGVYSVEVCVHFFQNTNGLRLLSIDVTGTASYDYDTSLPIGASDPVMMRCVFSKTFAAGDTIRALVWQNSGGNLDVVSSRTRMTANMIRRAP